MVLKKCSARFSGTATFSAVLLLAACGGGGSDSPPPITQPAQPQPQPTPQPTPEGVTLASTYTDLVDESTIGQINADWPDRSGTGALIAGVACIGTVASHTHSLVAIYRDGIRMAVPHSIGIVPGCTYELHTHHRSGVVHVEPNVERPLTLGQFFAVWNQPLSRTAVAGLPGPVRFYVIDKETLTRFDGNPADITFTPHKEIVIVTGTVPVVLPRYRWPAGL